MYQRTGAPLHASYALPQLRAFYANKDNQALAKTIDQWKTIASICIHRWTGKPRVQMPITYSEASWTGMLDFRTGYWDDEVVELVESCEGICMWTMSYEEGEEVYDEGIDILPVSCLCRQAVMFHLAFSFLMLYRSIRLFSPADLGL